MTQIDRPDWLPKEEWPFELRALEIDGHRIHYTDEGEGPVLLFVHAGFWSFLWREVIMRLRSDLRCVSLDFPGAGLSKARPGYETAFRPHAEVLGRFVDRLGLRNVTLIGHDLGSVVGIGWAAQRPDLVAGLVIVNGFGWRPDTVGLRTMMRMMGSRPMRAIGTATNFLPRASSTSLGVGKAFGPAGRAAFRAPYRVRSARTPFYDLMRTATRSDEWLADLERALDTSLAGLPLLTIFGAHNDPFRFQLRWRTLFPEAQQVVVPKGNHFPMCDDPDLVASSVRDWMSTLSEPRSVARNIRRART